jgi:hypothetical protein
VQDRIWQAAEHNPRCSRIHAPAPALQTVESKSKMKNLSRHISTGSQAAGAAMQSPLSRDGGATLVNPEVAS